MNTLIENEEKKIETIKKVCDFVKLDVQTFESVDLKSVIKEICVLRLCKAICLPMFYFKSDFFDFFACIMGEAICRKFSINLRIASDELRLVKYNNINLVNEVFNYLNNEVVEAAFLDAFHLVDKFSYIIPQLKRSSMS